MGKSVSLLDLVYGITADDHVVIIFPGFWVAAYPKLGVM